MPKTLVKTVEGQIIGGMFSNRENADKAVKAFREKGISILDIEVVVQLNKQQTKEVFTDILTERGFSESQARYHDKAIRAGKILVVVYGVADPATVIDIFDKFKAEYNPNESRNLRDDVAGMTVGTVVGATLGAVVGAVAGGPVGSATGAVAGAVVGGGTGALAGTAVEHRK